MKKILLVFLFTASMNTLADDHFKFKGISLAGNGCPQGSASVVESLDQQSVSILFDEFRVEVPGEDGPISSKSCNILINTSLKDDERVSAIELSVDMRGYVLIEGNAMAKLQSFLLGWNGPRRQKVNRKNQAIDEFWAKTIDQDIFLSKTIEIPINSNCSVHGDDEAQFRLKNVISTMLPRRGSIDGSMALLSLDSSDIAGSLKVKIKTRPCKNIDAPGHGRRISPRRNHERRPRFNRGWRRF